MIAARAPCGGMPSSLASIFSGLKRWQKHLSRVGSKCLCQRALAGSSSVCVSAKGLYAPSRPELNQAGRGKMGR